MMKILFYIGFALCLVGSVGFTYASDAEEVELVHLMGSLQYFLQKTGLSITAENSVLAKFYMHELEEVIEEVMEVDAYDNHPIGQLTKAMLLPAFSSLEEKVKSAEMKNSDKEYDAVINACNSCHIATKHEFIKIQRNADNPYLQSFGN